MEKSKERVEMLFKISWPADLGTSWLSEEDVAQGLDPTFKVQKAPHVIIYERLKTDKPRDISLTVGSCSFDAFDYQKTTNIEQVMVGLFPKEGIKHVTYETE